MKLVWFILLVVVLVPIYVVIIKLFQPVEFFRAIWDHRKPVSDDVVVDLSRRRRKPWYKRLLRIR